MKLYSRECTDLIVSGFKSIVLQHWLRVCTLPPSCADCAAVEGNAEDADDEAGANGPKVSVLLLLLPAPPPPLPAPCSLRNGVDASFDLMARAAAAAFILGLLKSAFNTRFGFLAVGTVEFSVDDNGDGAADAAADDVRAMSFLIDQGMALVCVLSAGILHLHLQIAKCNETGSAI